MYINRGTSGSHFKPTYPLCLPNPYGDLGIHNNSGNNAIKPDCIYNIQSKTNHQSS
jgi:hypothetical protein